MNLDKRIKDVAKEDYPNFFEIGGDCEVPLSNTRTNHSEMDQASSTGTPELPDPSRTGRSGKKPRSTNISDEENVNTEVQKKKTKVQSKKNKKNDINKSPVTLVSKKISNFQRRRSSLHQSVPGGNQLRKLPSGGC